jgi:DNA polymerase-1
LSEYLLGDIETNGLKPDRIWMVGIIDLVTDEYTAYIGDDEVPVGLMRLAEAELVVGHNFKGYDAPVIKRLSDGLIDLTRVEDTLDLSRRLFPNRSSHSLEAWGLEFGYPKLHFKDFSKFSPEMVPYCERDVRLNKRLYEFLLDKEEIFLREGVII